MDPLLKVQSLVPTALLVPVVTGTPSLQAAARMQAHGLPRLQTLHMATVTNEGVMSSVHNYSDFI